MSTLKSILPLGLLFAVWCLVSYNELFHINTNLLSQQQNTAAEHVVEEAQVKQPRAPWMKTSAHVCNRELDKALFKSQDEEDKGLLQWFGNLCNGTYVEIGGLDGVKFSNSYVYNKGLDWKGVMVELGPRNFANLQANRPNELATVHAAVCDKHQMIHFVESDAVGGIWEFMSPSFRAKWFSGRTVNHTTPLECKPLKDIFNETVGENFYFDFFTLDIEGAEYEAVASLDFTKVGFGMIVVEADGHNERKNMALRTLLENKGYTYLDHYKRNYWFVNREFGDIYKDFLH